MGAASTRARVARIGTFISFIAVTACGGGDDGGDYGICDRSALESRDCLEATGPSAGSARRDCIAQGATWSEGSCPTAELIGICSYPVFDVDIRQFFYTDPDRTGDPEVQCVNTVRNGVPGEWEDAAP